MPKRKRNKNFYKNSKRRKTGPQPLAEGVKGILITSGDQGKFCVPEAYNLLNEYADQLYGPEAGASDHTPSGSDGEGEEGEPSVDISRSLEEEVAKLKQLKSENKRRFSAMDTGAKHVVFIRCSEEVDPNQLVYTILNDAYQTRIKKSRYCQRILPVSIVCRANMMDICQNTETMLKPYFHENYIDMHTYCVQYKSRNSDLLKREAVTRMVADLVTREDEYPHRVDFEAPEYVVDVNVICSLCCLGVLKDFHKFRKYNLQTLTNPPVTTAPLPDETPATGNLPVPPSNESLKLPTTEATDSLPVQAQPTPSIPVSSFLPDDYSSNSPASRLPCPSLEYSTPDKDPSSDVSNNFRYFSAEAADVFAENAGVVDDHVRIALDQPSDQPSDAGDRPSDAGDRPSDAGDQPSDAGDRPSDAGDRPSDAGDRPSDAVDQPSDAGDQPSDAVDRPSDAGDRPSDAGDQPSDKKHPEPTGVIAAAPTSLVDTNQNPTSGVCAGVAESHAMTKTAGDTLGTEISTESDQGLEREANSNPELDIRLDITKQLSQDEMPGDFSGKGVGRDHQLEGSEDADQKFGSSLDLAKDLLDGEMAGELSRTDKNIENTYQLEECEDSDAKLEFTKKCSSREDLNADFVTSCDLNSEKNKVNSDILTNPVTDRHED